MKRVARDQIDRAPDTPGVYLFKGEGDRVLYVGKAKNLKDRLRSYLHPNRDERPSVALLVPRVEQVEWLLTDNEKEALLLENSLIKTHRPRYNIMLRDDKSYASLRMTRHAFPRLFVTRRIIKDGGEYFGPYSSVADLRQTLKLMQKLFLLRDCSDSFFQNRSRPCLQNQIKRCSAPCVAYVSEKEYDDQVKQARLFLSGERKTLIAQLRSEMMKASQSQNYEDAARLRDRLAAVEETLEPQKVESRKDDREADAVGLAGDQDATLLKVLKIRRGRMVAADEFFIQEPISVSAEILRAFWQHYYLGDSPANTIPAQLLVATDVPDAGLFQTLLAERLQRKVEIRVPKRGPAVRLLRLAERNAASSLAERKRASDQNQELLKDLQHKLHLSKLPQRIEGYDVSNFHGAQPFGSRVVFVDGEADKTKYRIYRIRTVKGSNDFGMLREMFERRFRKLEDENRPDLVLVDGGKGQLRQVSDVVRDLQIEGIPLASLAKEKELRSRSGTRYAPERIFLPGQKNPIIFPPSSKVLHLLQRIRDEAHRFGITRHRTARDQATLESILNRISGVGPKRKKALLRGLGSVEKVRGAGLNELSAVAGVTPSVAREVYNFFRAVKNGEDE